MRSASILTALLLGQALAASTALAQTSPAFGPLAAGSSATPGPEAARDIPMADYLGLLKQIAPSAESAARTYLGALQLRCGRTLSTAELRQAVSEGEGNPALMGLIRAAHQKDTAARDRLVAQLPCPRGDTR
ncbi:MULTISPECIES: hypothetical protein [Comamonadaceae]|uniref:Uncharacterized protein n=1 Tax=Alicycliphilus denitrificans (strain DSM 14773 / CIP 107495 / K601) TaxID=596154 RepID=F4G9V8_ALIDK|nr:MULTISPECIES: hypothetical protein [Comamonadaceae]AEB85690.1 hypothetical protein Alide2_3350 [Alicycliphilus denitrificans K601]